MQYKSKMKPSNVKPEDLEPPPNSVKDKLQKMNNRCGFPHEQSCLNAALQITSGGRKIGIFFLVLYWLRDGLKLSVCDLTSSSVAKKTFP